MSHDEAQSARELQLGTDVKRVFLLGAGASRAYTESPSGLRPPLASGLLPAYRNLPLSEDRHVLVGALVNYVCETRRIRATDFCQWEEDIEAFLTEVGSALESVIARGIGPSTSDIDRLQLLRLPQVQSELTFLLVAIFNEIQNGPTCGNYLAFARHIGVHDTILTFNWDTLLDRALFSQGRWNLESGYGIAPEAVFRDGWQSTIDKHDDSHGLKLLKLHGSTNWLMPYQSLNPSTGTARSYSEHSAGQLFVFREATQPYDTYEGRYSGPYAPFSYCYYPPNLPVARDAPAPGNREIRVLSAIDLPEHGTISIGDPRVPSMPLIIPPELNKNYRVYGDLFDRIWLQAEDALADCQELYIIGYSFPGTDTESRRLMRSATQRNRNLEKIVIVNPQPVPIVELFRNEFSATEHSLRVYETSFEQRAGSFDWLFAAK